MSEGKPVWVRGKGRGGSEEMRRIVEMGVGVFFHTHSAVWWGEKRHSILSLLSGCIYVYVLDVRAAYWRAGERAETHDERNKKTPFVNYHTVVHTSIVTPTRHRLKF